MVFGQYQISVHAIIIRKTVIMNFLIYGAGALGQALGCMLAADGHSVDLVLRHRFIAPMEQNGLSVTGIFGNYSTPRENLKLFSRLSDSTATYDYILLTTKSYDTESSIKDIATLDKRFRAVVSMQNGCGNLELLGQHFPPEKCLGARVITGFEIAAPGHVKITVSADAIHIGGYHRGNTSPAAMELATVIAHAGHPSVAVDNIYQSLHAKLLYNCTLNPLGAILGVHYGALGEQHETKKIMNAIITETFNVLLALGEKTPWPDAESYQRIFYEQLLPATYHHRPSMLQDLENGKPTEVDALVGYVCAQGKRYGVPTPTCDLLESLVKFRENSGLKTHS